MKVQSIKCDPKGRLYIRRSWRERYGNEFIVVAAPNELILMPVPQDPVSDLAELGKALPEVSLKKLRAGIRRQAELEVGR